jgi:hypothetical protein
MYRLAGSRAEQSSQYSGTDSGKQRKTHQNWPFFDVFAIF